MSAATGLLATVAAVLVLVMTRDGTYRVEAVFTDVRGLVEGGEVRAGGIEVGTVERIELGRDGLPHAELSISDDFRMRRGSIATVRTASLSGEFNAYVSVTSGRGAPLADGALLSRSSTRSPVSIDSALQVLDPRVRHDVKRVLSAARTGFGERGPDIERTLSRSARTLRAVRGVVGDVGADGEALRTLVRSTRQVAAGLVEDTGELGGAIDEMAGVLRTSAARQESLRAALARLPAALDSTRGALAAADLAIPPLRSLVAAARPGVAQLPAAARDLEPVLHDARPAVARLASFGRSAPADLRALRPLLANARPFSRDLAGALLVGGPVLDETRVRLPDFFSFFSNWADFTSNYDANGHAARVGIVFPPAPTNVTPPDSTAPGQLKAPFLRVPGALEGEPWRDYRDSFVSGKGR